MSNSPTQEPAGQAGFNAPAAAIANGPVVPPPAAAPEPVFPPAAVQEPNFEYQSARTIVARSPQIQARLRALPLMGMRQWAAEANRLANMFQRGMTVLYRRTTRAHHDPQLRGGEWRMGLIYDFFADDFMVEDTLTGERITVDRSDLALRETEE